MLGTDAAAAAAVSILLLTDELMNQNEVLRVATVSSDGRTITTRQRIRFNHYGGEYQAEVALLSRRVLFTSDTTYTSSSLGELPIKITKPPTLETPPGFSPPWLRQSTATSYVTCRAGLLASVARGFRTTMCQAD
jgi:hypothetical protein